MRKLSLDAVAREQLKLAKENSNQRSAKTVYGGHEHALRQSVIALAAGAVMADHISPGEAALAQALDVELDSFRHLLDDVGLAVGECDNSGQVGAPRAEAAVFGALDDDRVVGHVDLPSMPACFRMLQ